MSNSRKSNLFLDEYRKAKGEMSDEDNGLSQKIMEITKAGKSTMPISEQLTCILCDTRDVCDPCDASDWGCGHWEVICIFSDSCDMRDEIAPKKVTQE